MAVDFVKRAEADQSTVSNLAEKCGLKRGIAELLVERGITSPEQAEAFFSPSLTKMQSPFKINGVAGTVKRIKEAQSDNERILIYGDYDCDGICSVAMFLKFFSKTNDNVRFYIPNRNEEGYGMSVAALETLIADFAPQLIISVDCGITAVKEVEFVKSKGIDVIITDHHEPQQQIPATTVVDPKTQEGIFRDYCGAGVVFKIIEACVGLTEAMQYLPIAATATVADIVPLVADNRAIVHFGLEAINSEEAATVYKVWKRALGLTDVKASDIMFQVAPRLNAAGRIDDASKVIGMFLTESEEEILEMFTELTSDNNERKAICETTIAEAREQLLRYDLAKNRIIVLKDKRWNAGVVGIAAAKIADEFSRPTILLSEKEDGMLRGSARSIAGVNLFECLSNFSDYFVSFGGHVSAVGLSLMAADFDNFVADVNNYLRKNCENSLFLPKIPYDIEILSDDLTLDFADDLTLFEPTGYGNPQPIFKLKDAGEMSYKRIAATNHIKAEKGSFELVGFGMGKRLGLYNGGSDTTFVASVREFRGRRYFGGTVKFDVLNSSVRFNNSSLSALQLETMAFGEADEPQNLMEFDENSFNLSDDVFGTLFVCFSPETFRKAVEKAELSGKKLAANVHWTTVKNPYNRIVLLPEEDFPMEYYDSIVFLDQPPATGYTKFLKNKYPNADFYLDVKAGETTLSADVGKLSDDDLRFVFSKFKEYLRYHSARSVFDVYVALKGTGLKFSACQTYVAYGVFKELNLICADENGLLKIDNHKCNLNDSYIYRKYIGNK